MDMIASISLTTKFINQMSTQGVTVSEKSTWLVHRSHIASNKYFIILSQGTCATHDNSRNS